MLYYTEIYNKDAAFTGKKFFKEFFPPAIHPAKVWCCARAVDGACDLKKKKKMST